VRSSMRSGLAWAQVVSVVWMPYGMPCAHNDAVMMYAGC
jgi:hypothetical protein